MRQTKGVSTILIFVLFTFFSFSCRNSSVPVSPSPQFRGYSCSIISNMKQGETNVLWLTQNNDSIYLFSYKDSIKEKNQILASSKVVQMIRKSIEYHCQLQSLMEERKDVMDDGARVVFTIQTNENKIQTTYSKLDSYKDVSLNFDSLIVELKREEPIFQKYFN